MPQPIARQTALSASVSELSMLRWDLEEELEHLARHGIEGVGLWRTKLSDVGVATARGLVRRYRRRVSSLQWAGGFTGSDGRNFRESVDDALDAIGAAAAVGAGVLVLHTGCRGGHTLGHAHRLLLEACETLAPAAWNSGVRLAIQPLHPDAAAGCGFLTGLSQAVDWIERFDHPAIGLALDLWHFGHDPALPALLPRLVRRLFLVKVADRVESPTGGGERLLPGTGRLPLESQVGTLLALGYAGDVEFEAVGETVEAAGYDATLGHVRQIADGWSRRLGQGRPLSRPGIATTIGG